jgi:hypothetical protein
VVPAASNGPRGMAKASGTCGVRPVATVNLIERTYSCTNSCGGYKPPLLKFAQCWASRRSFGSSAGPRAGTRSIIPKWSAGSPRQCLLRACFGSRVNRRVRRSSLRTDLSPAKKSARLSGPRDVFDGDNGGPGRGRPALAIRDRAQQLVGPKTSPLSAGQRAEPLVEVARKNQGAAVFLGDLIFRSLRRLGLCSSAGASA